MFVVKLDNIIRRDIEELTSCGVISAAVKLAPVMKANLNSVGGFSAKGLPQYFTGNRKGKTVMVNLNPGKAAKVSDDEWATKKSQFTGYTTEKLVDYLLDQCENFGLYDKDKDFPTETRYDEFDIKQAAFLTPWENSGINIPENPDWSDRKTCLEAKTRVLCDKYQLELVPYASSKFAINPNGIHLFRPYVQTLLNEIFSEKREYVIFASAIFEKVFEDYNKEYPDTFDLSRPAVVGETFKPNGKLRGRCKVIVINYQGKTQKALIAHTFSSQALCRAFSLMQKYGQFCYSEFVK